MLVRRRYQIRRGQDGVNDVRRSHGCVVLRSDNTSDSIDYNLSIRCDLDLQMSALHSLKLVKARFQILKVHDLWKVVIIEDLDLLRIAQLHTNPIISSTSGDVASLHLRDQSTYLRKIGLLNGFIDRHEDGDIA